MRFIPVSCANMLIIGGLSATATVVRTSKQCWNAVFLYVHRLGSCEKAHIALGNPLAQSLTTFVPMNTPAPNFIAPLPTEIPDYVWSPRYAHPSWIPGRPVKKPKDTSKRILHPDAESALQAAKKACRGNAGRWFGRAPEGPTAFWVYEGNKVVERHLG